MDHIAIQQADFSAQTLYEKLRAASLGTGAIASFVGLVRDINDNTAIESLYLEHYPEMTEKALHTIVAEAKQRWALLAVSVVHRVGDLCPGDQVVYVGVSSAHRQAAFAACEFIMDYLKTDAPFWKKETTAEGERWLTSRQSDLDAKRRWT